MSNSSGEVGGVYRLLLRAAVSAGSLLVPPKILLVSDVNDDTKPLVTDADDS